MRKQQSTSELLSTSRWAEFLCIAAQTATRLNLLSATWAVPGPEEQRTVWIQNTLSLGRIGVSEGLARQAASLEGWRLTPQTLTLEFDSAGNLPVLTQIGPSERIARPRPCN